MLMALKVTWQIKTVRLAGPYQRSISQYTLSRICYGYLNSNKCDTHEIQGKPRESLGIS